MNIQGTVIDATTNKPVPGVSIRLFDTSPDSQSFLPGTWLSDDAGNFDITDAPEDMTGIAVDFQHVSYNTEDKISTDAYGNVYLHQKTNDLPGVVVTSVKKAVNTYVKASPDHKILWIVGAALGATLITVLIMHHHKN